MFYLLFLFYLAVACLLIIRIPFIKNSGIGPRIILFLFLIKICAGLLVGWLTLKYFPANDYWGMNWEGMNEHRLLCADPGTFFASIFKSPYNHYSGFFNSVGSYWNDLRYNLVIKFLAFCNFFSRGDYYINSLFLNTFSFFGHVALYRVFADIYKNKKWLIIIGSFMLPSALFYSSAIHKDLFVFTMIGLFFYGVYFSSTTKLTRRRIIIISCSAVGLFLLRNFVFVALIPAAVAYMVSRKTNRSPILSFASTYAIFLLLLILLQCLIPSFEPLKIITQKQADYLSLPMSSTHLKTIVLTPDIQSFFRNIPAALNHGFLRPTLWESSGFLIPIAIELLIYQILFVQIFFLRSRGHKFNDPFILFVLFFSISMISIIGFIIPNTGSIVRYRSLYYPLIIIPILCSISIKDHFKPHIKFENM